MATLSQKREAVRQYVVCGNFRAAGEATGINWQTIASWKYSDPEWWDREVQEAALSMLSALTEASQHKALELRGRCLELIEDRLEKGDAKFNVKTGELMRVPVSMADITKTFVAIGGQPVKPKAEAEKSDEERLLELTKVAEEDRAERELQ